MDDRLILVLATAVGCGALLPMLRRRVWLYWTSLMLFGLAVILVSIVRSTAPYFEENSAVNLAAFFIVLPTGLAYLLCSLPVFRKRRVAMAVCAPLFYALGVVVAVNVGMQIGALRH